MLRDPIADDSSCLGAYGRGMGGRLFHLGLAYVEEEIDLST